MAARVFQRESKQAPWSRWIALFSAQFTVLGVVLHRFFDLSTPYATNLLAVGVGLALLSLLLACMAILQVWWYGVVGAGRAAAGIVVSLLVLAGPAWFLPDLLFLPKINDITTDLSNPPRFEVLVDKRPADANILTYPGRQVALRQLVAYPDLRPMFLEKSDEAAFDLVRESIQKLGWEIVDERKPTETLPGKIEAVSRTLVMGYADDVVVHVAAAGQAARIDVRSASRYGEHDFGENARRIRRLFAIVKSGLEQGEKTVLELALSRRAKASREARRKAELEEKRKKAEELRETRRARVRARSAVRRQKKRRTRRRRRSGGGEASPTFFRRFGE